MFAENEMEFDLIGTGGGAISVFVLYIEYKTAALLPAARTCATIEHSFM